MFLSVTSTGSDLIRLEQPRPHTTVITLNRPERMNSMSFDLMVPLRDAFEQLADDILVLRRR